MELDIPSVGKIYSECEPTVYGITTSQKRGYVLISASYKECLCAKINGFEMSLHTVLHNALSTDQLRI